METNRSLVLEQVGIIAYRYVAGSTNVEEEKLGLQLLPKIEKAMDESGEFFIPGRLNKFESLDGILYKSQDGKEVEVPWKQYIEWARPAQIHGKETITYSPVTK